jgi:hypothetical protein
MRCPMPRYLNRKNMPASLNIGMHLVVRIIVLVRRRRSHAERAYYREHPGAERNLHGYALRHRWTIAIRTAS